MVKNWVKNSALDFPKPIALKRIRIEARVGIAQQFRPTQFSPKPFSSGHFSKCCTAKEISTYTGVNQVSKPLQMRTFFNQYKHL
jgi:hypothetical protein